MRYQLLGPLRVVNENAGVSIRARKVEVILAALLVRRDHVVSIEDLITEVWEQDPPVRATAAVHVYISQLRKLLTQPGGKANPIDTRAPGYLLRAHPEDLDSTAFQRLVRQGREHLRRKDHEAASSDLGDALSLWHGPALSHLPHGPLISGFQTSIEELRHECIEMHIESNLALGRHRELVSRLYSLIAEHPLHEVFYCQLMQALVRCQRRADALSVYRLAWETFDCELGLEPGPRLRELQRAILTADTDRHLHAAV
jgi:DNA-binding SARP family transcriptional activator